jgi:hypothetical protein
MRPALFLLPPLLVIAGCGGGASGEAPTPGASPGGASAERREATGPVIRWDEAEHGPLGVAQRWADEGGFVNELKDILSGRDPRGAKMRARLEDLDDPVPEVLTELLDYFDKSGHPTLISVLRDFPRDFAMVLVKVAQSRPEFAMRMAHKGLFVGRKPLREAWAYGPLRTTVARLCKRTEFETTDIQGGPARVWALRVAGLATVKEAKDGILLAAGYAKGDNGHRLAADPYGPAEAMAKQIIRQKMRKKR